MFQRKPLNTAISMAFSAMAAVSVNAHADAIFFPHVVVSDTVTTIVSVINTTEDLYTRGGRPIDWDKRDGSGFLHYTLFYKDAAIAANNLPCTELNAFLPTSLNDIQTIDLGGRDPQINDANVLFEPGLRFVDTAGFDYALGQQARDIMAGKPALRGYLLVDNAESDSGVYTSDEATLHGEAFVIEYGVGATWGYAAFSKQDDTETPETGDFDNEFDFEDAASISGYPVGVLPLAGAEEVISSFMVTPVIRPRAPTTGEGGQSYADSDMSEPAGDSKVSLYLANTERSKDNWGTKVGMWDRDERPVSGGIIRDVTCVGRVPILSLITNSAVAPGLLENGGWGRLKNSAVYTYVSGSGVQTSSATAREEGAAVIYKLEYGETLNGIGVGGTWNNAFLIPNSYEVYSD